MIRFTASVGPLGVRGVDGGEHFGEEFAGQARGGDLAVGVSVVEPVEEAFLAACVERSGEQQPADAVERVTTAASVSDTWVIRGGAGLDEHHLERARGRGSAVSVFVPCVARSCSVDGQEVITLGDRMLDEYLVFVAARARRNTWLAVASDLKIFFEIVGKSPAAVTTADVFDFLAAQRRPRLGGNVVRLDGEAGLAARTIARRLSSVRGLFDYLVVRGDADVGMNVVPRSLAARRPMDRRRGRGVPVVRTPRTLPRVLSPAAVDSLRAALRTRRDRAMVEAMLLGGLRRCEVLGLRLEDLRVGERRVFVAAGKGGRQRLVPISARFFATVADYLDHERPTTSDALFVVLKGPRRGQPLSASGLDEILSGAKARAGLEYVTCHQLRHTCFTRLREAGMALEAIQAQAGHASIESTRIYVHLANDWLAGEYRRALDKLDGEAV